MIGLFLKFLLLVFLYLKIFIFTLKKFLKFDIYIYKL